MNLSWNKALAPRDLTLLLTIIFSAFTLSLTLINSIDLVRNLRHSNDKLLREYTHLNSPVLAGNLPYSALPGRTFRFSPRIC